MIILPVYTGMFKHVRHILSPQKNRGLLYPLAIKSSFQRPPLRRSTKCSVDSFWMCYVVGESAAVFQTLAGEDESLLVRWDSFLVLDASLDSVDGVGGVQLQSARDGLTSQSSDKDLHGY